MIGTFNPAIFQPSWLAMNGVVTTDDAEDAKIAIIHPEFAEFEVGGFTIKVEPERFQINTLKEPFVSLLDTVLVVFGKLLTHTPINQAGINYGVHFAVDSPDQRHRLGRALAPLDPWGEWGTSLETGDLKTTGGMRSLVIEQTKAPRRDHGYRRVHIEPSVRQDLVDPTIGVYMMVNDHFQVPSEEAAKMAAACVEWLEENFEVSLLESKKIVSDVMDFAGGL